LNRRKAKRPLFATSDKLGHPERFYVAFRFEPKLLLNFNFNPKALTIETILVSKLQAFHRIETLKQVFVRAAPCMVDAHWVVGCDWAVQIGPAIVTFVQISSLLKRVLSFPEFKHAVFQLWEIYACVHLSVHVPYVSSTTLGSNCFSNSPTRVLIVLSAERQLSK
jgi:hypothetical protein